MNNKENKKPIQAITLTILITTITLTLLYNIEFYTNSDGIYIQPLQAYIVKSHNPIPRTIYISMHELGHHIYYKNLNKTEKQEWKNISLTQNNTNDPEEDFANTFAQSITCRYTTNPNIEENKKQFIKNLFYNRKFEKQN